MTDLEKMIAAVEAGGGWQTRVHVLGRTRNRDARLAYNGSLDAAKRLHDELLPGWDWYVDSDNAEVWGPDDQGPKVSVHQQQHARAWLLAILRAVKASSPPP